MDENWRGRCRAGGGAQKQVVSRTPVEMLGEKPGLRPQDVIIVPVAVLPENRSFGHGAAQYAK